MVLGLLTHVTPSIFFCRIIRSEALVENSYFFFRTVVLRKLFEIRFSYKHCHFSRVCLLVKMASKTVTRSIKISSIKFSVETDKKCFPWFYTVLNVKKSTTYLLHLFVFFELSCSSSKAATCINSNGQGMLILWSSSFCNFSSVLLRRISA